MKIYLLVAALLAVSVLAGPVCAGTIFSDDFESGVSGSTWEAMPTGPYYQILVGDSAHARGTQSAKQVNADPWMYYMRTKSGAFPSPGLVQAGQKEILTCWMWDDNVQTTGANAGVMLVNFTGSDLYQFVVNSAYSMTNYCWRTQLEGTFVSSVARSQGWHKFQIEVNPYTGASGDVKFYIDDAFVANGKRKGDFVLDSVRLGISIKSQDSPFWYDDVNLTMVPEPGSVLGLLTGLIVLAGIARRRFTG